MSSETDKLLVGVRVLVVEDDPHGAKLLKIVLEQAGAIVQVTSSVGQVRRRLRAFDPTLVLLDLVLNDGHGFDVLKRLRPRIARGELTVVVISSVNGPQTMSALTELGCAAYFRKPIETATLASNLAGYVRARHE